MRQLMLVTLIASLLAGCGAAPTTPDVAVKRSSKPTAAAAKASVKPSLRVLPGQAEGPSVSVKAGAATADVADASRQSALDLLTTDATMDAIELLIQDGGAYFVQGFFGDLWDKVKATWQRFKLSREVKANLKSSRDKAAEMHKEEIAAIKKNRTEPVDKVAPLEGGGHLITTTWTSTSNGTFEVMARREIDADGVNQVISVWVTGTDKKGTKIELSRIRTLVGEDGTYKVATKRTATFKDGTSTHEEWLKTCNADGTETLTGFIVNADGYRTEITGTRDAKGKVNVEVVKVDPAPKDDEA